MNTDIKLGIIVFVVIFGFFTTMIFISKAIREQDQELETKKRTDYYECKEKGNDVEWCFIKFNPVIE